MIVIASLSLKTLALPFELGREHQASALPVTIYPENSYSLLKQNIDLFYNIIVKNIKYFKITK